MQCLKQEWFVNMNFKDVRGGAGSSKVNSVTVAAWPRAAHSPLIRHRPSTKGMVKNFQGLDR